MKRNVLFPFLMSAVFFASFSYGEPEGAPEKAAAPQLDAVPKLSIVWECGACEANQKVPPLIEKAYEAEALKNGKAISSTESVNAKIYQFRQRNPGARVMFGIMAGKDRLTMRISYKGQDIDVGDYSANSVHGMNSLCESVGKEAYKKISQIR